jgi:hypothetical protein
MEANEGKGRYILATTRVASMDDIGKRCSGRTVAEGQMARFTVDLSDEGETVDSWISS